MPVRPGSGCNWLKTGLGRSFFLSVFQLQPVFSCKIQSNCNHGPVEKPVQSSPVLVFFWSHRPDFKSLVVTRVLVHVLDAHCRCRCHSYCRVVVNLSFVLLLFLLSCCCCSCCLVVVVLIVSFHFFVVSIQLADVLMKSARGHVGMVKGVCIVDICKPQSTRKRLYSWQY